MTNALLNPNSFEWAKTLLESMAWSMIVNDSPYETSITFSILKSCPSKELVQCSTLLQDSVEAIEIQNNDTPEKQSII
jgi:hypothetical protein